ncbi:MAG: altronate dehydratase, partial [Flavobacterium sp.]
MKQQVLKVHPQDNVLVALTDLKAGQTVTYQGADYVLVDDIDAKHKFYMTDMNAGDEVNMYGT